MNASPTGDATSTSTRTLSDSISKTQAEPRDVVLVPYGCDLARGFARALTILDGGAPVRLIGEGVTLPSTWPPWVGGREGLSLSELGSYQVGDPATVTRPIRAEVEAWLDDLFRGIFPGLSGGLLTYGTVLSRGLNDLVLAYPAITEIARRHGSARVHCTDPRWICRHFLRMKLEQGGGSLVEDSAQAPRWWRLRLIALTAVGFAASAAELARQYVQSAPYRRALRGLRGAKGDEAPPRTWVVCFPDWYRFNHHLLTTFVSRVLEGPDRLGVLLSGALRPGTRDEANLKAWNGTELWPGLSFLKDHLDRCAVDQISSVESVRELVVVGCRAAYRTFRLALRLATSPAIVARGPLRVNLAPHVMDLVRLITMDVLRGTAAEHATRCAARRHDFRGTRVVFPGANTVQQTVPDLLLQQQGATTIECYHGAWGYVVGAAQTRCTFRCFWTYTDAAAAAALGQRTLVGGAPTMAPRRRPGGVAARNILIMSNYVHRDSRGTDGTLPEGQFQEELLEVVMLVREAFGDRFDFRWRPHPADDSGRISRTLDRFRGVELSRGRSLAEDAAWADLVISSPSSVAIEVLFAEVPVFVHVAPKWQDSTTALAFDATRRFFRAREVLDPLIACVAALDRGDDGALEPERRVRRALFGPTGFPRTVAEAIEGEAVPVAAETSRKGPAAAGR